MTKIQKPEISDGTHGVWSNTEEWTGDDFTLYQMARIAEEIEVVREQWLNGNANAHTVTMSQWIAKWSLDVSSKLAETLINQQEEEGGE